MFANNEMEFVILKLSFVPNQIDISDPIVSNYWSGTILPLRAQPLRDWFYHLISKEYLEIPNLQYRVWKIKSNDIGMFTINNLRFDNLLLFVGETNIHWIYHNIVPVFRSAEGITPLTLNYCNCCFYAQYPEFIESIQGNLKATGYLLS